MHTKLKILTFTCILIQSIGFYSTRAKQVRQLTNLLNQQNGQLNPTALSSEEDAGFLSDEQQLATSLPLEDSIIAQGGDPLATAEQYIGIVLLIFAIVITWCNESKLVKVDTFMKEAKKECRSVNVEDPQPRNDYYLVHASGDVQNIEEIKDSAFGVSAANSYRLLRKVEMLQWVETISSVSGQATAGLEYRYSKEWLEQPVDSSRFAKPHQDHQNPKMSWPFESQTFEAPLVQLGEYKLTTKQIARLGITSETQQWDEEGQTVIDQTRGALQFEGFPRLEQMNEYFYSSATQTQGLTEPHIGQYRVSFHYSPCGPATVIAQQIFDDESDTFTFRNWDLEKRNVPAGQQEATDDTAKVTSTSFCYLTEVFNHYFDFFIQPDIDLINENKIDPTVFLTEKEQEMKRNDAYIRVLGVALTVIGFLLISYPIAKEIKMIQVLKWVFHASNIAAISLYCLILGATLSIFIIATSWFAQKPLIGIFMYIAVAVSVYLLLCFEWDKSIGPNYLISAIGQKIAGN